MNRICIKPTLKCNFNCPTCHERRQLHSSIQNDKQLNYSEWIKILIDSHIKLGATEVTISGAEPLYYDNLINLVNDSYDIGYTRISINTNGALLNKQMSDILFNSKLTNICISFTDANKHIYAEAKGIKNETMYDNVFNNIKYFNFNKPAGISSDNILFVTKNNLKHLEYIINRAKLLKFNSLGVDLLEGNFSDNKYKINKYELENYLRTKPNIPKKIIELLNVAVNENYKTECDYVNCDIPGNFCIILPNGDLHPCNIIEYSHEVAFNMFDYDIDIYKIFTSDEMSNFIKNKSKFCSKCQMHLGVSVNF